MKHAILTLLCLHSAGSQLQPGKLQRSGYRVRPAAVLRAKDGSVRIRCSHGHTEDWRGILLHPGDTVEVGRPGWASLSLEASGARYLLVAGSGVRIDNSRLTWLRGPVPRYGSETPRQHSGRGEKEQKM